MAAEDRTVRVCGIPADIEEERLKDKLWIHFMRHRNGGGDIASVSTFKTTPNFALIVFEDYEVAQSVVQRGKQFLQIDDKLYELTVSLHHKKVDPNKIILNMTVTVDYSQLPMGKAGLTNMHQSFPDVHFHFSPSQELCTCKGHYSRIQALVTHLLGSQAIHMSGSESSLDTVPKYTEERRPAYGSLDLPQDIDGQVEAGLRGQTTSVNVKNMRPSSSETTHTDQTLDGSSKMKDRSREPTGDSPVDEHSLMMDADIFRYLQKKCSEEFHRIHSQHGVEVVDVTDGDVTTLFLQSGTRAEGRGKEHVLQVHRELGRLYQEMEAQLRKEQLPKKLLPSAVLEQALEALQLRLPRLLLSNDPTHLSFVGSCSDVSDAKQFLLDLGQPEEDAKSVTASHTASLEPEEEDVLSHARVDKMLKTNSARKSETGREYKLAARFREARSKLSGENGLGSRLGQTTQYKYGDPLKEVSSVATKGMLGSWKTLGSRFVLDDVPKLVTGTVEEETRENAHRDFINVLNRTGSDKILQQFSPLPSTLPREEPLLTNPLSTMQHMDLFEKREALASWQPPKGSGVQPTLRRANSFSGRVRAKQDVKESNAGDTPGKTTRARSGSFRENAARADIYSVEVSVPRLMWRYMKEAYNIRLEDITSDLEVKESHSGRVVTVNLKGTKPARLNACQEELKKLVETVATDFDVQELPLAQLGVANPEDKTLEMYCAELRHSFQKVHIQRVCKSLFIIGPKRVRSKVIRALMEVFGTLPGLSGQSSATPSTDIQDPETTTMNHNLLSDNLDEHRRPQDESEMLNEDGQASGINRTNNNIQPSDSFQRHKNGDDTVGTDTGMSQSAICKETVIQQHLGKGRLKDEESRRKNSAIDSGPTSLPVSLYSTQKGTVAEDDRNLTSRGTGRLTPKENQSLLTEPRNRESSEGETVPSQRHSSHTFPGREENWTQAKEGPLCVCGAWGSSVTQTACGVALCPQCLPEAHALCRVCPKADVARGVRGTFKYTELPISLAGHMKDTTLKITYIIPNGIQGEGHPSPGAPFQGGVFEAYLPRCQHAKGLLLQLEKAFKQGLTFTVARRGAVDQVAWGSISHKTRMDGGRSKNGYPDAGYLHRLAEELMSLGVEATVKAQDKTK